MLFLYVIMSDINDLRTDWHAAREAANNSLTGIAASSLQKINEALTQARIRIDSSYAKLQHAEVLVAHVEIQLAVEAQWEVGGPEYNGFKMEAHISKYCAAEG
jgi:hypothetical protein